MPPTFRAARLRIRQGDRAAAREDGASSRHLGLSPDSANSSASTAATNVFTRYSIDLLLAIPGSFA